MAIQVYTVEDFNKMMNEKKSDKTPKKKSGSFHDSLGPEDRLQSACLNWVRAQYPELIWHHSPNEGKRGRFERFRIKLMGVQSGFPDWITFNTFTYHGHIKKGLVVEFKATTKVTENQQKWLDQLSKNGFFVEVIYNFEEFEQLITKCYGTK